MNQKPGSQNDSGRKLIETLARQFEKLHARSCSLISGTPPEMLYCNARPSTTLPVHTVGENILRSAAAIEQTFGGITASLWDDPFEWTLPENLSTARLVIEYLEEVEATRQRAFASFHEDSDLRKEVFVPDGGTKPLLDLLIEALVKAADYQGRAVAAQAWL